jgi:hypothetical protein
MRNSTPSYGTDSQKTASTKEKVTNFQHELTDLNEE